MVSAKTQGELEDLEPPPPSKRQKIQPLQPEYEKPTYQQNPQQLVASTQQTEQLSDRRTIMSSTGFQPEREIEVGILHVVNSANKGFTGVLKQR